MSTNNLILGSELPYFNLIGTDRKLYSPNNFTKDKIIIIIFSCNHCPYVQAYEKRIIKIQSDYRDHLQIISINSNDANAYPEDSFENMKNRSETIGFNFPYLHDEDQSVAKLFDATHTPEIFLFDEKRKLRFHGKIDDNWQDENSVNSHYLRNAIEEIVENKEVSVPETFTIGCTIKWKV